MGALEIDPDAITKYISEKIAESVLGEKLKEAIDKETSNIGYERSRNIFEPLISSYIQQAAREYLETPAIKAKISKLVTEKLTEDAIDEMVTGAIEQMRLRRF